MSARNDIGAAGPSVGQLRERVEMMRGNPVDSVEVRPGHLAGLRATGGVA